jgi:hypothetical protein
MTAKSDSRTRRAAPRAKAPAKPELTAEAVVTILESRALPDEFAGIDPGLRREMIAAEAYRIAEQRGFAPGHEFDDWIAAESLIDAKLGSARAA